MDPGAGPSRGAHRENPDAMSNTFGSGRALRPSEVPLQARAYGHDFGHVRIHDGPAAHAATEAFDSKAFAWGRHVVLSPAAGPSTLAHELAHVVQQSGAGGGTVDFAPVGGALERDAAVAAGSGRPPRLRAAARQVQRDGPLGQVGLFPAERATLDAYLPQHGFLPLRNGVAKFDNKETSSAVIATKAQKDVLPNSTYALIKNDIDRRILQATLSASPPPVSQYPKTTGQKIEDLFTRKPSGGDPSVQPTPPSVAPRGDDLNKITTKPIPGDQSLLKRAGIPVGPSQTPDIPLPDPGKQSNLFQYAPPLQARYAIGTAIGFVLTAPPGFWKREGVKKVVLVPGEHGQPVAAADYKRDGQAVSWAVPADPGAYTVMVTVNGDPESGSAHKIQVYKPASQ